MIQISSNKKQATEKEEILLPTKEVFKIKGKLCYHESAQAWNTIKIKKEIFWIFPELKDKRSNFNYTMIVPRNHEQVEEQFEKIKKNSCLVPILLFFEKIKNTDD